jgi:hypothetical protein
LLKSFSGKAKKLHAQLEKEYKERYEGYKKMAGGITKTALPIF